jgi:hypothetical protein
MTARRLLTVDDLRGQPGLSRAACAHLVRAQPATVREALRVRGVGRGTTRRLLRLGLLTDPDHLQGHAVSLDADWGPADRRTMP